MISSKSLAQNFGLVFESTEAPQLGWLQPGMKRMKRKLALLGALVATEDCGSEQCRAMEGLPMCGSWCQDGSSEVRQIETPPKKGGRENLGELGRDSF